MTLFAFCQYLCRGVYKMPLLYENMSSSRRKLLSASCVCVCVHLDNDVKGQRVKARPVKQNDTTSEDDKLKGESKRKDFT